MPDAWSDLVLVGRIVRPQGNRGEVVVAPETDFAERRFRPGASLQAVRGDRKRTLTVVKSREHQGRWIIGFEGIGSIDEAETLRGLELLIFAAELQPLGDGAFYVHDLAGLRVETAAGTIVGTVDHVQFAAGVPLLIVAGTHGEVLVPFVERICQRVDVANGVIVIDPPAGLLEANERQSGPGDAPK